MTKDFQMVHKTHADKKCSLDFLSRSVEENVRAYHRSFPCLQGDTPRLSQGNGKGPLAFLPSM